MTTALVVEDDNGDMAAIEDTLCSMQHWFERTTNQADALRLAAERNFDYAIVDLRIPARPDRSHADVEFGGNLLRDLRQRLPESKLPIIVMADDVNCFGMARWLIDKGASEFICKPFHTTHELGDVIRRVLKKNHHPETLSISRVDNSLRSFSGGDLQIGENDARLLGVPIASRGGTGYCLDILGHLAKRGADGRSLARSAEELASQFDILGGQTSVAGYVRTIRSNITNRLHRDLALDCGRDDVLERTTSGYRLRDWITIKSVETATPTTVEPQPCAAGLNVRQSWVVTQLSLGKPVDRPMIEKKFGIHEKTAKRDLTDLTRRKVIEYVRDGQGGLYRLVTTRISA